MQRYKVLINNNFSAGTAYSGPYSVSLINGLYLNTIGLGGGITNSGNVNSYLNNSSNAQITTDFYGFLTGATTAQEFSLIFSDNQTLSNVFNSYYNNFILSASTATSTVELADSVSGATQLTSYQYYNDWLTAQLINTPIISGITLNFSGDSVVAVPYTFLQNISTDESYYVTIVLNRTNELLSPDAPTLCPNEIVQSTAYLYPQFSAATGYFSANTPSFYIAGSAATESTNTMLSPIVQGNINVLMGSAATTNIPTGDTNIHTIVNCFVDLNLNISKNSLYYYNP